MDILKELNPQQQEAVQTVNVPLLISAGAGSGKTRVITYKIIYLIKELKITPYHILGVTFTNKAADEMYRRVSHLLHQKKINLWISTFHSLCSYILKKEWKSPFIIIDENDKKSIIKEKVVQKDLDLDIYVPSVISSLISKLKNNKISSENKRSDFVPEEYNAFFEIYGEYEEYKQNNQYFDFDDLLINTLRLFYLNKSILDIYKNRFQHILVDEFQDTNDLQYELIYLLGFEKKNITIVGDPDQSIYSWRGASVYNFQRFKQDFKDYKIIKLEQNYRSTNNILKAASSLITHNTSYDQKNLWSDKKEGEKIKIFSGSFIEDESNFIVNTIMELKEKSCPYREIAIFCRTNYYYENLEFALREKNIPYKIIGGVKFFERLEIKNLMAYFKFLINFKDEISLLKIINIPNRGLGRQTIEKLKILALQRKTSLFTLLQEIDQYDILENKRRIIKDFVHLIQKLSKQKEKMSIVDFSKYLIKQIHYGDYLEKFPEFEVRMNNVDEFLKDINEFYNKYKQVTLQDYIDKISLISEIDKLDESEDKVNIITIHNAKGLEFPVVFIIGLHEGMFPHYKVLQSQHVDRDMEEERRLFYVGITRTKELLYLTYCQTQRLLYQSKVKVTRGSLFLSEIPEKYKKYLME